MGIKFHCPNGHKLHVKSYLSGKRAICPDCGAKVMVPEDSTVQVGIGANGGRTEIPRGAAAGSDFSVDQADTPEPSNRTTPADAVLAAGDPFSPGDRNVSSNGVALEPAAPAVVASGAGGLVSYSAIAEAPAAVWYVRPPSGGQFGPAAGETMRVWIETGRVAPTALVWRAGWPQWQVAGGVFPHLATAGGVAPPLASDPGPVIVATAVAPSAPLATGATPVAPTLVQPATGGSFAALAEDIFAPGRIEAPLTAGQRKRKNSNDGALIATICLIVLAIVLTVVLIYVLNRDTAPQPQESQSKAAAADGVRCHRPVERLA